MSHPRAVFPPSALTEYQAGAGFKAMAVEYQGAWTPNEVIVKRRVRAVDAGMIHHFVIIDGQPVAKGRARSTRSGMHYTPSKTRNWESMAALALNRAIGSQCYNVPLKMEVTAYFQRPQRLMRKSSDPNRIHHTVKPDADNILKAVSDALVKAHVVTDDCIINWQMCVKYYCAKDVAPHVAVHLSSWENEIERRK